MKEQEKPTISRKLQKRFDKKLNRLCEQLNILLDECKKEVPGSTLYLDGSYALHLMSGDSHETDGTANYDKIIASAFLDASGGDW
jgi:hypothetical protein